MQEYIAEMLDMAQSNAVCLSCSTVTVCHHPNEEQQVRAVCARHTQVEQLFAKTSENGLLFSLVLS